LKGEAGDPPQDREKGGIPNGATRKHRGQKGSPFKKGENTRARPVRRVETCATVQEKNNKKKGKNGKDKKVLWLKKKKRTARSSRQAWFQRGQPKQKTRKGNVKIREGRKQTFSIAG